MTGGATSRQAMIKGGDSDQGMNREEPTGSLQVGARPVFRERRALVCRALRFCLPEQRSIDLPGLGALHLRPGVRDFEANTTWIADVRRSCEEVAIECAGSPALLLIDTGFALHAVNAILGCERLAAGGPLSRIERGILLGALAALSAHLCLSPNVRLSENEDQSPPACPIVVEISLRLRGVAGRAWLCASEEFLNQNIREPLPGSSRAALRLELGCTGIVRSDLATSEVGDAVVFDEVAALSATEPWPVQVRRGREGMPASLLADGTLVLASGDDDGSRSGVTTQAERFSRRPSGSFAVAAGGSKQGPCADVTAEIGGLRGVPLGALLGEVPLHQRRSDPVLLRADDVLWAEGEIAAIDGALVVRITRMLAD